MVLGQTKIGFTYVFNSPLLYLIQKQQVLCTNINIMLGRFNQSSKQAKAVNAVPCQFNAKTFQLQSASAVALS